MKAQGTEKKSSTLKISQIAEPKEFPWWIAAIFFLLTTFLFFSSQLTGNSFFWEDFLRYVYPVQSFAASQGSSGIPFWNPYSFGGMPFFADLQVGFFYPLNRLLSLFVDSNGVLPVYALQFVIILHFFIAQLTAFFLARSFKISSIGSVISAVSFAFSLLMVCHVFHPMMLELLAWFPLVILFFWKGLEQGKWLYALIAGLVYGVSLLAGHPQIALYESMFLAILFIVFFIYKVAKKELKAAAAVKSICLAILPVAIAMGIFAVQLLPSNEMAALSQREEISYEKSTETSLQFKQILVSVVPKLFGTEEGKNDKSSFYLKFRDKLQSFYYWETAFYFGVITLMLGFAGLLSSYRSAKGAALIIAAIIGFLLALGDNGFLYSIFFNLPMFGSFRNPARLMLFVVIAFSLFAGMGFDALRKNVLSGRKQKVLIALSSVVFLIAFLAAVGFLPSLYESPQQHKSVYTTSGILSVLFIILTILMAVSIKQRWLNPTIAGVILIIGVFADLFFAGSSFNRSPVNPKDFYKIDPKMAASLKANPPNDLFRVNMRKYQPYPGRAMEDNQGLLMKIMLIEGYNPLLLKHVLPVGNDFDKKLDLLNVKYELAIDTVRGSMGFRERQNRLPRAWLVDSVIEVEGEAQIVEAMNAGFDFAHTAVIEGKLKTPIKRYLLADSVDRMTSRLSAPIEAAECIAFDNNSFKYKVNAAENSFLCISEIWYPAWTAYIDGAPTPLLKTNSSFIGIEMPKGEHVVEVKYESATYASGFTLSMVTLLASLVLCVVIVIFQKKVNETEK
jgi:hypothetical protein